MLKPTLFILFFFNAFSMVKAAYPESFELKGHLKNSFQVSSLVKASEGGTLETKDDVGNIYRLKIPAQALAIDTIVRMTPVEITGVPGQLAHWGVDILPAGTRLLVPASLEIIPKQGLTGNYYWLETSGASSEFQAYPSFPVTGGKSTELDHFSGGSLALGDAQTLAAMNGGGKADSADWFKWQRNLVQQEFEAGRIDKITRDAKMKIIEDRIGAEVEKDIQQMLEKSREEADAAIDRAERQAEEGNPADWESFFDNLSTYLQDVRRSELLGLDGSSSAKFKEVLSQYLEALYRNCEKRPLGVRLTYKAERIRQLLGIAQTNWDLEKCFGGNKIFHVRAEYILKNKKAPSYAYRYLDNISKTLDIMLTVQYQAPQADIVVYVSDFNDEKTKYDLKYESQIFVGEGCPATQQPFGDHEVFDYNLNTKITASYNPGFALPPGVPLPPGFPDIKPTGSILLMTEGVQRTLGWKIVSEDPAHCPVKDEPPILTTVNLNMGFDPVLLEKIGTKKFESHVSEDDSKKEGWVYTIERVN